MQHLDADDCRALTLLGGLFDSGPTRWVHEQDLVAHERALRWADSREWITRRLHGPSRQWRLSLTRLGERELAVFLRQLGG